MEGNREGEGRGERRERNCLSIVQMTRLEDSGQAIDLNAEPDSCVPCSICLDLVSSDGDRSTAKLQCGHEFHLGNYQTQALLLFFFFPSHLLFL